MLESLEIEKPYAFTFTVTNNFLKLWIGLNFTISKYPGLIRSDSDHISYERLSYKAYIPRL